MVATVGRWVWAGCLIAALSASDVSPGRAANKVAVASRADAELVATLIRSTLIGLHHANLTGNYTVLRDLGSPAFQQHNTAADLGIIFLPVRQQGVDLESVAVLQPKLNPQPAIDSSNKMVIKGSFDTKPKAFKFELVFELVGNNWLLFSISVGTA